MKKLICLLVLLLATIAAAAQSADDSDAKPPVTKADIQIVQRARAILDTPAQWNRADNRQCPAKETTFSLYCALEQATYDVTGDFAHRGAAMQEARFVIDDDLAPNNHYQHRLMNFNNDSKVTFVTVQRFFDLLQGRVEGRLEQQSLAGQPVPATPSSAATAADLAVIQQVEAILDSPVKWDRASTQDCAPNATKFGLFCAFAAASIKVTGNPDYNGPAIVQARQLISRTPNAGNYHARLVDYNNDPAVTFADLQQLLRTVESNLQKLLAPPAGR